MAMHQPSNFATYCDTAGMPVFDTFFVLSDWGNGEDLFAFRSPHDRQRAIEVFREKGFIGQALSHQEAFLKIRGGTRAWVHNGDLPSEMVWAPIKISYPARVA